MADSRACCCNSFSGAAGCFLYGKLHLPGMDLHLRLGYYILRDFIGGGTQLALTLSHAANVARCSFGGSNFSFRPLAWQIHSTARVLLCVGQHAAPGLFVADTVLTGGVGAARLDLLCGAALPALFNLLAGKLAPLLYGEVGVFLDNRIRCISYHPTGVVGGGIAAIYLRRGAFPQLSSAFLLCLRQCLFQRHSGDFPGRIAFRHPPGGLFFNIFHSITSVIKYSNRISKSFKRFLNSAHKSPL